jgi:hypothetical protein
MTMGLFDFFDSRKSLARWAAKCFRTVREKNPNASDAEIIELAIRSRYATGPSLSNSQKKILQDHRNEAVDIHSLCHVIAEVELLNHLSYSDRRDMTMKSENIVEHTYNVISEELERLGFPKKQINKINPLEEKCPNHPEKAAKFPCAICGRFVCSDCILEDKGLKYCKNEKCREKAKICHNHPQKSSFSYCFICEQFYCADCLTKVWEDKIEGQAYTSYVCKNEKCQQQLDEIKRGVR